MFSLLKNKFLWVFNMNHQVTLQAKGLNPLPKQMCRYSVGDVTDVLQVFFRLLQGNSQNMPISICVFILLCHVNVLSDTFSCGSTGKALWLLEICLAVWTHWSLFFGGGFVFILTCNPHKDKMLIVIVPLSPRVQNNASSGILSHWTQSQMSRIQVFHVRCSYEEISPSNSLCKCFIIGAHFPSLGEVWLLCSPSDSLWRFDSPSPGGLFHSVRICWPFVSCSW